MKTGNTPGTRWIGHLTRLPQWSPVMKTGNTSRVTAAVDLSEYGLNGARS